MKRRNLVLIFISILLIGGGIAGYRVYYYIENNPVFCKSCHIMETAFASWEKSVHVRVNCHDCHHLSPKEGMHLMFSFVFKRPTAVPPRHGKIIVLGKFCIQCHFEVNKKYPQAVSIKASLFHEKHGFEKKIECSRCHGYKTHEFLPEERFCITCHKGKEVHGTGMVELACLNCHSDRTKDLRPEREKCLFCHGSDEVRVQMIREKRLDVKHFTPDPETIKKAIKIGELPGSKHQFDCYACHQPHEKARPGWNECMNCHGDIVNKGKHELHAKVMNINCGECHRLHSWVVTQEEANKRCIKCHESAKIYKKWSG